MHNDEIGSYMDFQRKIEPFIPNKCYNAQRGVTDNEAFFLLAFNHGFLSNPLLAIAHAVEDAKTDMWRNNVSDPIRLTTAYTGAKQSVSVRYSTNDQSPILFLKTGSELDVLNGMVGMKKEPNLQLSYVSHLM